MNKQVEKKEITIEDFSPDNQKFLKDILEKIQEIAKELYKNKKLKPSKKSKGENLPIFPQDKSKKTKQEEKSGKGEGRIEGEEKLKEEKKEEGKDKEKSSKEDRKSSGEESIEKDKSKEKGSEGESKGESKKEKSDKGESIEKSKRDKEEKKGKESKEKSEEKEKEEKGESKKEESIEKEEGIKKGSSEDKEKSERKESDKGSEESDESKDKEDIKDIKEEIDKELEERLKEATNLKRKLEELLEKLEELKKEIEKKRIEELLEKIRNKGLSPNNAILVLLKLKNSLMNLNALVRRLPIHIVKIEEKRRPLPIREIDIPYKETMGVKVAKILDTKFVFGIDTSGSMEGFIGQSLNFLDALVNKAKQTLKQKGIKGFIGVKADKTIELKKPKLLLNGVLLAGDSNLSTCIPLPSKLLNMYNMSDIIVYLKGGGGSEFTQFFDTAFGITMREKNILSKQGFFFGRKFNYEIYKLWYDKVLKTYFAKEGKSKEYRFCIKTIEDMRRFWEMQRKMGLLSSSYIVSTNYLEKINYFEKGYKILNLIENGKFKVDFIVFYSDLDIFLKEKKMENWIKLIEEKKKKITFIFIIVDTFISFEKGDGITLETLLTKGKDLVKKYLDKIPKVFLYGNSKYFKVYPVLYVKVEGKTGFVFLKDFVKMLVESVKV